MGNPSPKGAAAIVGCPALDSPLQLCFTQQARFSVTGGGVLLQLLLPKPPLKPKAPLPRPMGWGLGGARLSLNCVRMVFVLSYVCDGVT